MLTLKSIGDAVQSTAIEVAVSMSKSTLMQTGHVNVWAATFVYEKFGAKATDALRRLLRKKESQP